MKTFKDALSRDWSIELTVLSFKKTRAEFGDLLDPEYFLKKIDDAVFLVDLLFALCKAQADERQIDPDAFARGFWGDSVEDAKKALAEEYVDFFPSRARTVMKNALKKIETIREEILAKEELNAETMVPSATSGVDGL